MIAPPLTIAVFVDMVTGYDFLAAVISFFFEYIGKINFFINENVLFFVL